MYLFFVCRLVRVAEQSQATLLGEIFVRINNLKTHRLSEDNLNFCFFKHPFHFKNVTFMFVSPKMLQLDYADLYCHWRSLFITV